MSQYTTSIKAMIELEALKEGIKPYELRIDDYITRGRKLLFNFTYSGDTVFKEYFEKRFITKFLLENINNEYPPLWLRSLESIVQISAPLYYLKYQGLNQLTIDKMLSDGIRLTEINKDGTADSEGTGNTRVNDVTTHNNRDVISDTSTNTKSGSTTKTGTVTSVYDDDSTDRTTTEATSSGTGSGSSTNTNSAFPFNVASTTSVNAIAYKTDGGKVESSNSASNTDSSSSQTIHADDSTKTETYNTTDGVSITDTSSDNRTDTFTGADERNGSTSRSDTKADSFKEHELVNEKLTGNLLDKVMKLYSIDFNPIEAFVNELYSKLFILLW